MPSEAVSNQSLFGSNASDALGENGDAERPGCAPALVEVMPPAPLVSVLRL